jgi:hypothetical protein
VKLLIGAASISRSSLTKRQTKDHSILPPVEQAKNSTLAFSDFLNSSGINLTPKEFVHTTISDNRSFYRDILNEFSNYFYQTERTGHTAAFVFLYRILERLSYTVPLLYCSTQTDYIGTFNDLKLLFNPDLQGELGLFKKFINQGKFIEPLKLDVVFQINFTSEFGFQGNYFKTTKKHHADFVSTQEAISQIEIKFREVPELLKSLRNRFFHSRTGDGRQNIRVDEIPDSDEYFSCINHVFCSFLATICLETISHRYQKRT